MRYHQGRLIRQNELFVRNSKVCGLFLIVLIGGLALAS